MQKAKDLEAQLNVLREKLKAAKKRPRDAPTPRPTEAVAAGMGNPKKRPSPEPKPKPVGHLVDIMATAVNVVGDSSIYDM